MTAHTLKATIATLRLKLSQIGCDDPTAAAQLRRDIIALESKLMQELGCADTGTTELARLWRDAPNDMSTQIQLAIHLR